ncbi:MAG: FAD-dependent oxidoreductase [Ktedonobacteraceae bacterium]
MARTQYDMTIIGGGSGGLSAARIAASLGANVLLVDKEKLGGDCLHYGCVPSKSLLHVARIVRQAQEAMSIGLAPASLGVDMAKISKYVQGVIERVGEAEKVYVEHVTVKFGDITFKSPTELLLNGEACTSRNTIIATGSRPAVPNLEGLKECGYYTNNDLFNLEQLPASLIVIGGGPIGVEMGQAFARLGSKVTLITRAKRILPKEDIDASTTLANVLTSEGIHLVTGAIPVKVERNGDKKVVTVKQGEEHQTFEAEHILVALGRHPNIEGLALEAANITYDAKGIKVDEHLQTSAPNIYAIGDVVGGYLFTHVAAYQAGVAVRNALVPISKKKVDYRVVPWCTFTEPEVARVGLTVEEAEKQYKDVRIEVFPFANVDRAQAENETTGFIKLVLTGKKAEIVGAHIVGLRAGELLGEMTLAIQHNMTINDIYNTIHAYPTMATGIQQAAFEAYLKSDAAASNRNVVRTLLTFR